MTRRGFSNFDPPKIQTEAFSFEGGLDLVTPALGLPSGKVIGSQNFEADISGGYRRMYGYERLDGRPAPSAALYWNMIVILSAAVTAGQTVVGATSGATAVVLQVNGSTELIVTKLTGTFIAETINVLGIPKGTVSFVSVTAASTAALHAQYKSLAANNYRADIQAVPGSGPVRGVWYYNGTVYAFRDNVGATSCIMYKSTAAGWVAVTFGREIQFVARSSIVTITIAAPGVITWNAHALAANQPVVFSTDGALPTGLTAGTTYYVLAPAANTFTVSATPGGAAITTSGTQSGTHTATLAAVPIFSDDNPRSSIVTISIASPAIITWANNGLGLNQPIKFSTTGALPTGLVAGTTYYVTLPTTNTFEVSATPGGVAINTSGTQNGVHTATLGEGDRVVGSVSGAIGIARRVLLRTGSWPINPVGTIVFDTVTGAFQNGEALLVDSMAHAQASSVDTPIALLPGGRYEFSNYNFAGTTATYRMYGCDGVNFLFEFDGTRLVPIRTGIVPDAPKYLAIWKNMIVVAIASSVEVSGIGQPYSWTALTGASELALGDTCTGLLPQLGDANTGAIAIFTIRKTFILYGNSSADFKLVEQSPDAGAYPYSAQNIGSAYYLDAKGVVQINSTRNYGNFIASTLTRAIQPLIDSKRGLVTASCIVRATNQYRLFFSDGTGILLYMVPGSVSPYSGATGDSIGAIMPFDYGASLYMFMVSSTVDLTGIERTFAASSNGFVYELERGTSFDGGNIFAYFISAFNSSKTPRNRKHYKRTIVQAFCANTATVQIGYDLSYSNQDAESGSRTTQVLLGPGNWWDRFTWDQFTWDAPYVTDYIVDTPGDGDNMSMIVFGDSAVDEPYTIHSAITNYTVRRLER